MNQNQDRHRAGEPGGVGGRFRKRDFAPPDPSVELGAGDEEAFADSSTRADEHDATVGAVGAVDVPSMLSQLDPSQPVAVRRRAATAAAIFDDLGEAAARDSDVLVRANALWSPGLKQETRRALEADPEIGRLLQALTT